MFKRNKEGFTFLEILISSALVSMVFIVIFSVFWTGLKVKKRSRKIAQRYMGARIVLDTMARELRSAADFDYSTYKNFEWEPNVTDSENIIKRLTFWKVACDGMALATKGLSPIARNVYYVKKEKEDGRNEKRIIYRKVEPVYPMEKERVLEGPMIEGDFDLEVDYPLKDSVEDREALPIRITIYFKIDEEQELVKSVYLPQYKKK